MEKIRNEELQLGYQLMSFLSTINKVIYSRCGKFAGACAQEGIPQIVDIDQERICKCRPGHNGNALNICFEPSSKFVCTTGCDGYARIYSISNLDEIMEVKSLKIGREIKQEHQILQPSWNEHSHLLALPGTNYLLITSEELKWVIQPIPEINHKEVRAKTSTSLVSLGSAPLVLPRASARVALRPTEAGGYDREDDRASFSLFPGDHRRCMCARACAVQKEEGR